MSALHLSTAALGPDFRNFLRRPWDLLRSLSTAHELNWTDLQQGDPVTGRRVHWPRASTSRPDWLVGAQSVLALWTLPLENTCSEPEFRCEQTLSSCKHYCNLMVSFSWFILIWQPMTSPGADLGFYKGGCPILLKGAPKVECPPPPNYFDPCYRNQTIFLALEKIVGARRSYDI